MDALVHAALAAHPGDVPLYVSVDAARDRVRVTTAPTPSARDVHFTTFDRATGARAPQEPAAADDALALARRLHMTLGFGLPGMLFLGAIGVLFIASIGSGLLLPGALALGRDGGERSRGRSPRAAWRLTHARVGVVATAWLVLVGATGVLGTLATPLMSRWERGELAALAAAAGPGGPAVPERVSVGTAIARALDAAPELRLEFVAFPGAAYGAKDHFAVYLRGTTLLTSRLTTTALVDASSGRLVGLRDASWYVQALSLSQPLHSGRFGGWPVKLLWALLTIATIVLCLSGVQLWWARLRRPRASD
jgi:uncharacterized iron-regulated membrane protein